MNNGIIVGTGGETPGLKSISQKDNNHKIENLKSLQPNDSVYRTALSLSGEYYAYATKKGNIHLFSRQNDKKVSQFLHLGYQVPMVIGLTFIEDQILVSAGSDKNVKFFDMNNNNIVKTLSFQAYSFGLNYIGSNLLTCIQRDHQGDHLVIYNTDNYTRIYLGPPFKIPSNYVFAKIDIDNEMGLLGHGDRNGNVHLYDLKNNYNQRIISTQLGDIQTLCFHNNQIFVAGENQTGIMCFDLNNQEQKYKIDTPENFIILERLNSQNLVGITKNFTAHIINYKNDNFATKSLGSIPNLRAASGYSNAYIKQKDNKEREQQLQKYLSDLKKAIKKEQYKHAYKIVKNIETMGLKQQALEALSVIERSRGNILDELEILMVLLSESEVCKENIELFQRLGYILEVLFEYELAKEIYQRLHEYDKNEDYKARIKKLDQLLEVSSKEGILFYPNDPKGIFNEIKKEQILHRNFNNKVIFKFWELEPLHSLPDDNIFSRMDKNIALYQESSEVALKLGNNVEKKKMHLFAPVNISESLENSIECLVCFVKKIETYIPYIYGVYLPEKEDNKIIESEIKQLLENKNIDDWFNNFMQKLETVLVSFTKKEDDYDGLFD